MARHPQILDHCGEPIRREVLTEELAGPTVTGVRSIWSTHPVRDLTPARLAAILRESEVPGDGAAEEYVELAEWMEERDPHYLGVLQTRRRQVAQIGVTIEPASDSAEDVRDADLVRSYFHRDEIEDELLDLLDALGKGYSVAEIIWEISERQWMPQRIEWRLPRWFDFDRRGGRLQRRSDEGVWVDLEPWKFITHFARAKSGIAIRGGLARIAAWGWLIKSYTLRDWARFCEAYGHPMRLGRYGPAATEQDLAVLYRAVRQLGVDMAAIIPEGMTIEFPGENAVQGRSELYRDLVGYIDGQISVAVLGQTLTTQPGESGSYALGQVHDLVRRDIERSDGRQLAATLRRDLVIPMVTLNHGPRPAYPRVIIERASDPDLELLSQSLERLIPLGLRVRADQIRTWYGLDPPDEEDEVLEAPMPAPGAPDPPSPPPARARDAGGGTMSAMAAAEDAADPVPALAARARREIGPLVDAWADEVRAAADAAASLEALGEWIDTRGVAIDTAEVERRLGAARVAAHLAGRYDVAVDAGDAEPDGADVARATEIALASASAEHTRLPFGEQIDFFRNKISLPTQSWTDPWQEDHDVAFVVAGAARDELLDDLRAAVDSAIAEGTTLETFRERFDITVARHGWDYRGGRDWRTEVIYRTNLRTSYAAGRWKQMKDIAERRPYWRYRHSRASAEPREQHLKWDGLILRHDDEWWDAHYPPNGWGCGCLVEALGPRDMERLGKTEPDQAPASPTRTVTVGKGGPTEREVEVPEGIDPGWAYAPGQRAPADEAIRHRLQQAVAQSPPIAAAGVAGALERDRILEALTAHWREWREAEPGPAHPDPYILGTFGWRTIEGLEARGVAVGTAAITIARRALGHATRDSKVEGLRALGAADIDRLPEIVARPRAVLYDRGEPGAKTGPTALLVFDPADQVAAGRAGKVVVRVGVSAHRRDGGGVRRKVPIHSVRTAGYLEAHNLREPRYEPLEGGVE